MNTLQYFDLSGYNNPLYKRLAIVCLIDNAK